MSEDESKLAVAYEKIANKAKAVFAESGEKTLAALEKAIESARESLVKAGEITQQESQNLKSFLRRDLEQSARLFQQFSQQAKDKVKTERLQASFLDITSHLSHSASHLFERLAEWADSTASYHTGQVTGPGVLRCKQCDKEMHFSKSGNIPPCPSCKKTDFRKVG